MRTEHPGVNDCFDCKFGYVVIRLGDAVGCGGIFSGGGHAFEPISQL